MLNVMSKEELLSIVQHLLEGSSIIDARKLAGMAYSVRDYLIDLVMSNHIEESDFYNITSLLSPQSRSPLWEKYFITKHGCTKTKAKDGKGDFVWNEVNYEFKASGYSQTNGVNIVQIRLWQQCDYVIQHIVDEAITTFILTHSQMKHETEVLKATVAHGTKEVVEENALIELRMTLRFNSDDWTRWESNYAVKNK